MTIGRMVVRRLSRSFTSRHPSPLTHGRSFCDSPKQPRHISWLPRELESGFISYKQRLVDEYNQLTDAITTSNQRNHESFRELSNRWNELRPIFDIIEEIDTLMQCDEDMRNLVKSISSPDSGDGASSDEERELIEMAQLEEAQRNQQLTCLEDKLLKLLIPPDASWLASACDLEIIAGAGGQEAGLFAVELLQMYRQLAYDRGWSCSVLSGGPSTTGDSCNDSEGLSKAVLRIEGSTSDVPSSSSCLGLGVYGQLRWEAGVHRVQRVPVTSKQHKIHTSTVAVAVLPVDDEYDLEIPPTDLKWDFFRASGAGGQHVNKTDSAVRLTHLPTNTIVSCQQERSLHQNKQTALRMLIERLCDSHRHSQSSTIDALRRSHIGQLERSEKIRTYNFQQDRVTDHRLGRSWAGLNRFMRQTSGLSEAIEALHGRDRLRALELLLKTDSNQQSTRD